MTAAARGWPAAVAGLAFSLVAGAMAEDAPLSTPEHRALVSAVSPDYYRRGRDTPAEFATSQLGYFNPVVRAIHWLIPERMRRDYFNFGADDEKAREVVARYKEEAERGWAWTEARRNITIPRLDPVCPDWSRAREFRGEIPLDRAGAPPCGNTVWRVAHDGERFLWRVDVEDAELRSAEPRPYEADSVEFFLKGDPQLAAYWEIVVGPSGAVFTAYHHFSREQGFRTSQIGVAPSRFTCQATTVPGGYRVEGAIPFAALARLDRPLPFPGAKVELMLVRTDAVKDGVAKSAPVPLLYDGHNIFGYMTATLE